MPTSISARADLRVLAAELGDGDQVQTLDFNRCYQAYRRILLGFMPSPIPNVSTIAHLLAIGEQERWESDGISAFDLYTQGMSERNVRRLKRVPEVRIFTLPVTLDPVEREQLAACDVVLAKAGMYFADAGRALTIINVNRLYRDTHAAFEDYCKEKWQIPRQHAYRLMEGAAVVDILSPMRDKLPALPQNERQVRPLVGLKKEDVLVAWQNALAAANGKGVTGRVVAKAAAAFIPPAVANQKGTTNQAKHTKDAAEPNEVAISTIRELISKAMRLIRDGAPADESLKLLEHIQVSVEAALAPVAVEKG